MSARENLSKSRIASEELFARIPGYRSYTVFGRRQLYRVYGEFTLKVTTHDGMERYVHPEYLLVSQQTIIGYSVSGGWALIKTVSTGTSARHKRQAYGLLRIMQDRIQAIKVMRVSDYSIYGEVSL